MLGDDKHRTRMVPLNQAESHSSTLKLDLTACCLAVFRKGTRNPPVCCRDFAISIPARNASGLDASAAVLQTPPFLCSSGFHLDASNTSVGRRCSCCRSRTPANGAPRVRLDVYPRPLPETREEADPKIPVLPNRARLC